MTSTQMSCSTIMPQKKANTMAGGKSVTNVGKTVVRSAAMIQWVAQPIAWPVARKRSGKISAMNTQITAPWPTAWEAMKANRHHGTIQDTPLANAQAHSPSDRM